ITGPVHGSLNLSTNGGFTYTPASNYFGADSFTYQINDGVTNSGTATVNLTNRKSIVQGEANDDSYGVNKNSSLTVAAPGVLGNDSALDGNTMAAVLVTGSAHGTLSLSTNGGFTYTPASNYFGADSFTYQINDGVTNSGTATVNLTITNVIRPPVANNDSYGLNKNSSLTMAAPGVLANDSDLDGNTMAALLVSGPAHGTLRLKANTSVLHTRDSNVFRPERVN